MAESLSFEEYRERYFIDPRSNTAPGLARSLDVLVNGLVEGAGATPNTSDIPLVEFAFDLSKEMQGARRFNHLSAAQLHPSDNMAGIIGHVASTLRNNNTVIGEVSPVETDYEQTAIAWLNQHISGFDRESSSGVLVSGGTMANITALFAARESLTADGWDGVEPALIVTNGMAHYSVDKAAKLLAPGGLIKVTRVPLKEGQFVMDTDKLKDTLETAKATGTRVMAVFGIAGETETGLVEDLSDIVELSQDYGTYLHIDAAYGGPFRLSRNGKRFEGIEESDSVTCDPHKYLYVPYAAGAVLFSNSRAAHHSSLNSLNTNGANYLFKTDEARRQAVRDFRESTETHIGLRRIEGSMGGQAATSIYSMIRCLGERGIGLILDHTLDLTEHLYDKIAASQLFEPLFMPDLNTLCVAPRGSMQNYNPSNEVIIEETVARIWRNHGVYITTTSLPIPDQSTGARVNRKVFRIVPTHPFMERSDIDMICQIMHDTWEEVLADS